MKSIIKLSIPNNNNSSIPSLIPLVESGEDSVYVDLSSMMFELSKIVAAPVHDPQKMHFYWRIQYTSHNIFGESEQHNLPYLGR